MSVQPATLTGKEKRSFSFLEFSFVFHGGERTVMEYAISPRVPVELHPQSRSPLTPATSGNSGVPAAHADSGPRPSISARVQYHDKSPETQRKMAAYVLTEYTVPECLVVHG